MWGFLKKIWEWIFGPKPDPEPEVPDVCTLPNARDLPPIEKWPIAARFNFTDEFKN